MAGKRKNVLTHNISPLPTYVTAWKMEDIPCVISPAKQDGAQQLYSTYYVSVPPHNRG